MIILFLSFLVSVGQSFCNIAVGAVRLFAILVSYRCSRRVSDAQIGVALAWRIARHLDTETNWPLSKMIFPIFARSPAVSSVRFIIDAGSDLRRWPAAGASQVGVGSHLCRRSQAACLEPDGPLANGADGHGKHLGNVTGILSGRVACDDPLLIINDKMDATVWIVCRLGPRLKCDNCSPTSFWKQTSAISHLDLTGLEVIVILRRETRPVRGLNMRGLSPTAWVPRFEGVNFYGASHGRD